MQAPDCPFPVQVLRGPLRPDLTKLGVQPLLAEDTEWADWVLQKHRDLTSGAFRLLVSAGFDQDQLERVVGLVADAIVARAPHGPVSADRELPWLAAPADPAGTACGPASAAPRSAQELLLGLTLSLQEDFAVMVPDQAGVLRARVLSVCFPSGWKPEEKLDQSFSELHAPVADSQELIAAAAALSHAMCSKGPFVRTVWTITGNAARARLPGLNTLMHAQSVDDLWFRCERQVTVPLAGQASLFLIRVFVCPLRRVIHSADRWVTLQQALVALSPEMVAYKGLDRAITIIMNDTSFGQFLLQESR